MAENLAVLARKIEHLRNKLEETAAAKRSLNDPEVLSLSRQLDHLVVRYRQLLSKKSQERAGDGNSMDPISPGRFVALAPVAWVSATFVCMLSSL